MHISTNEFYIVFSFIGFVLSVIPLYWHLQAWNTGTCMLMIWMGLSCLLQCVNSIVWNKNMINRAPVYCDISTRVQVALNIAISACSLCINRRLYKIAILKNVMITRADKRQAVIQDLLICVGIPILQIISQYIVSMNRYNIFEDFGPFPSTAQTPLAIILVHAWPVAVGTVTLFYSVPTIYLFYKRQHQFRKAMGSQGLGRGRYLRLMALSFLELLGTIPLGTFILVYGATGSEGVGPWRSWASIHHHYSKVFQVPSVVWENNRKDAVGLEMYRWLLVACSFVFFAFFGFGDEASRHYRLVYTSLASRIGLSTSTLHGSSHGTSSVPYVNRKTGAVITVVKTGGGNRRSSVSLTGTDEPSVRSISVAGDIEIAFKVERYPSSNTETSPSVESFEESKMQDKSTMPAVIMPLVPPASVPPHFSDKTKSTTRANSGAHAV